MFFLRANAASSSIGSITPCGNEGAEAAICDGPGQERKKRRKKKYENAKFKNTISFEIRLNLNELHTAIVLEETARFMAFTSAANVV
jgi:hypothetical protein